MWISCNPKLRHSKPVNGTSDAPRRLRRAGRWARMTAVGALTLALGVLLAVALPRAGGPVPLMAQVPCPVSSPAPAPPPSATATPFIPPPGGGGTETCYPPGWNLVGGPGYFPGPLWVWDPVTAQYDEQPPGQGFPRGPGPQPETNGQGAWAFFAQATDVPFSFVTPSGESVSVPLTAGQWQQIGDPFNYSSATVCKAGAPSPVFVYDPTAGAYHQSTMLTLGQGAWTYSPVDGALTLVPIVFPPVPCPSS